MAAVIEETYARGPNYVYAKEYVIKTYGQAKWDSVLANLPPKLAEKWRGALLASHSYSFGDFRSFTKIMTKQVGSFSQKENGKMYEYIADRSLNGIYKMFFRLSSPSYVIKNYPKLWSHFFNTGKVNVLSVQSGKAVIEFKVPEIFVDWLDDACYGYSKKAIELGGGSDLKLFRSKKEVADSGEWTMTYEITWEEK
jgi:hypothetical protein